MARSKGGRRTGSAIAGSGLAAVLLPLLVDVVPAQQPQRLLVGRKFLELPAAREVGDLGNRGQGAFSRWCGDQRYVCGEVSVDAGAGEFLVQDRSTLHLWTMQGRELWSVADVAFPAAVSTGRILAGNRVIVPRNGGGLVALDRRDGTVVWQRPDAPGRMVVADGEVVFAVGLVRDRLTLAGFAAANGARAFAVELDRDPQLLVPASHGVAVVSPERMIVYDRSGPELFRLDVAAAEVVGGAHWFVRAGRELLAFDRRGRPVWQQGVVADDLHALALAVTSAGQPLTVRFGATSDSGFGITCRAVEDGSVLWAHREEGLGIEHSNRHTVAARAIGDSVLVVSQGSGGAFVVELDAGDGSLRARHAVEN